MSELAFDACRQPKAALHRKYHADARQKTITESKTRQVTCYETPAESSEFPQQKA
jgi:hypothetical protein